MPATLTGRGGQVILTGQVRRASRGAAGNSLVENERIKVDLERLGSISAGYSSDGRTATAGAAHDVAVLAPETELDGNQSGTGVVTVPPGGSIQAAHDALPANGGTILLSPNTAYDMTATVSIIKPNVRLTAASWNTVVRRNATLTTGSLIVVTGAGCIVDGFTIDGNSVACLTHFDLNMHGDNGLVQRMQIKSAAGVGHLALAGNNSRATGNTITGLGIHLGTERGYGIWAIDHQTVTIDNNTISGTGIDGIGVDGNGSRVIGNRVFGCHCYTGGPGGQIAVYPLSGDQSGGNGVTIVGNTVGPGGAAAGASGIECDGPNAVVAGNTVDGVSSYGLLIFGNGTTVTGNYLRNCCSPGGSGDAVYTKPGVTDFIVSGNRISDERTPAQMRAGIWVQGASDRYAIVGNMVTGATLAAIIDNGTGTTKVVAHNTGHTTAVPAVAAAATITLPMNAVITLTGSASITAINLTTGSATGRTLIIIPTGTASFVGGAGGIANSVTCVPNVPLLAVYNGTNWYLK